MASREFGVPFDGRGILRSRITVEANPVKVVGQLRFQLCDSRSVDHVPLHVTAATRQLLLLEKVLDRASRTLRRALHQLNENRH
jgi:hypothetical protein